MTTPDLQEQWYRALGNEDCLEVMRLLKLDSHLLKVGWNEDPSRFSSGSLYPSFWDREKPDSTNMFRGSTALHVGARRGCADLIKQVLHLCGLKEVSNYHIVDEKSETDTVSTRGQSVSAEIESGAERNRQNIAGHDVLPGDDAPPQRDEQLFAPLKENPTMEKEITPEQSASVLDSSKHSTNDSVGKDTGDNLDTTSGDCFSRKDLTELIWAKRGQYGMDALEIAALHCNIDIVVLLIYAYLCCDKQPSLGRRHYGRLTLSPKISDEKDRAHRQNRERLRQATTQFIQGLNADKRRECLEMYAQDPNFNFLSPEEYLFHFWCTDTLRVDDDDDQLLLTLWENIKSLPDSLWRFVLELQDGQGRPPFHVAVEACEAESFMKLFKNKDDESIICALTARDSAGRTPAHRAASTAHEGNLSALRVILHYSYKYEEVSATCHTTWRHSCGRVLDRVSNNSYRDCPFTKPFMSGNFSAWEKIPDFLSDMSKYNGLRESPHAYNPLHAAVVHRNYKAAQLLIHKSFELGWNDISYFHEQRLPWDDKLGHFTDFANVEDAVIEWDLIEFTCLVRANAKFVGADIEFLQFLLKDYLTPFKKMKRMVGKDDPLRVGLLKEEKMKRNMWQAVHLVASFGNYELLKMFIDDEQCDLFVEDFEGNTALHHAMKVRKFNFDMHMLDKFPDFEYRDIIPEAEEKIPEDEMLAERKGCINLLLQAGCDGFKANQKKQVPYPQQNLNKSKFLSWWHDKQEKEFGISQNNLNFASNAISVTATLVATASYVGPLQPPMGYTGDPNQIQDEDIWVLLFIVCDTISFYLAIASIVLSLIPSLPMPQQAMMLELRRTRRMVTLAVLVLFPSIAFVFIAFGCSSLAVISAKITSSIGGSLTIATTCLGGLVCLLAFFLFSVRLLAFTIPRNTWIRHIYHYLS